MVILVCWVIKMARITITISDELEGLLLTTLKNKGNRRLFIERAIMSGFYSCELCDFFGIVPLHRMTLLDLMNHGPFRTSKDNPNLNEVTTKNPALNPTEHKQVPGKICATAKTSETNQIKIDSEFDIN